MAPRPRVTCRGSFAFRSACGDCDRCDVDPLNPKNASVWTSGDLKVVAAAVDRPYDAQFFAYTHLPPHLQEISQPFSALLDAMLLKLSHGPQRDRMVEKLLEAKDCAVRQRLAK